MLTPIYKGFQGVFDYDPENQNFFGTVRKVGTTLTFIGETPKQTIKEFEKTVDDYLEFCQGLETKAARGEDLDIKDIKALVNEIRERLVEVTPGPWRWGDWDTYYGAMEPSDLNKRRNLEFIESLGNSQGPIVRERVYDRKTIEILKIEDPIENERDAVFICNARQDVETLIGIIDFLLDKHSSKYPDETN